MSEFLPIKTELTSSFDEQGFQKVWNSTSLKLADECLRKYQYVALDNWSSREESVHLRFGGIYAAALEMFHNLTLGQGMDREDAILSCVSFAMIESWDYEKDAEGQRIEGTGGPWVSTHNLKTRENLIRTIIWYFEHFQFDNAKTIVFSDGKPAVELSAVLPVDNGIVFAAHLDRFIEFAGDPMIQDQKTTGSALNARYFAGYKPDIQMSLYTFLGKSVFGTPIKGVMIDGAQILVGSTYYERGMTFRTDSELNEFYDEMMAKIEQVHTAQRRDYFPRTVSSCGNYGGCPFREACSKAPQVRKQFLSASFDQKRMMDPLTHR